MKFTFVAVASILLFNANQSYAVQLSSEAAGAADAMAHCAGFTGPLIQNSAWVGSVDIEEQDFAGSITETTYTFRAKKWMGFVGEVDAPVGLKVLKTVDTSAIHVDRPATTRYVCELLY